MPAFDWKLSDRQIAAVASYMRALGGLFHFKLYVIAYWHRGTLQL
jgi:hypothetical protein